MSKLDIYSIEDFTVHKVGKAKKKPIEVEYFIAKENRAIQTAVGIMNVRKGDYVIKSPDRDIYAVAKEIFEMTYDIINE